MGVRVNTERGEMVVVGEEGISLGGIKVLGSSQDTKRWCCREGI